LATGLARPRGGRRRRGCRWWNTRF